MFRISPFVEYVAGCRPIQKRGNELSRGISKILTLPFLSLYLPNEAHKLLIQPFP